MESYPRENLKRIKVRQEYFCVSDAAKYLHVRDGDLRTHIRKGILPAPTRKLKGYVKFFYTEADLKKIEGMLL